MSASSTSLSQLDETDEPPPMPWQRLRAEQAAIEGAAEQKLWIQCTLNGAKHRGENSIEPIFQDDEKKGCSACLPDIVVVNDAGVKKISDAFASKAPAPWQRILTKAEAALITKKSRSNAPEVASTMHFNSDTYLYNAKRPIIWFQKLCATIYMSGFFVYLFGGGRSSSKFPNTEPAQKFRCGMKAFRERAFILILLVTAFCFGVRYYVLVFMHTNHLIYLARVNYQEIHTFQITCAGCKIQITNPTQPANWATLFHEDNNVIMYFPRTKEFTPFSVDKTKTECGKATMINEYKFGEFRSVEPFPCCDGHCHLVVKNNQLPSSLSNRAFFSDDSVDFDFYPYPTIDLIIDKKWANTVQLLINNDEMSSYENHPTIIVPFKAHPQPFSPLFPEASTAVELPSLFLDCFENRPIFFNGVRGGQYRNVTVTCKTGSFIAQGAEFVEGSVVNVTLPMGDIIISANQRMETTLSSIYSATPPFIDLSSTERFIFNISDNTPKGRLSIEGYNFRNYGALKLIVPNGTCSNSEALPGLGKRATVIFECSFDIQSSGHVSGPVLLSYFGGNLMPTGLNLEFSASVGESTSIASSKLTKSTGLYPLPHNPTGSDRYAGSEISCGEDVGLLYIGPENVCAVAVQETERVPSFSVVTANNSVIMLPANSETAKQNSFKFFSAASRSLTLGSFDYKKYDRDSSSLHSITNCSLEGTYGSLLGFTYNRHYNIPYNEQKKLLDAINSLQQNITDFVIIKIEGSGSNLPGYFTLTKRKIYTVIDPYIIQTLTFRLLRIRISAISVSFGAGLCPDLSSSNQSPDYEQHRIAQNYEILYNFMEAEEDKTMYLSFQFQSALQIFKSGFYHYNDDIDSPYSGYTLDHFYYLGKDPESMLLYISVFLPLAVSLFIFYFLDDYAMKKIHSYRNVLFKSTIEGDRACRIAPFSVLAQKSYVLSYHVKDLAAASWLFKLSGSVSGQSKIETELFNIISLFQIVERRPMPEYIRWACKIRNTEEYQNPLYDICCSRPSYTKLSDNDDLADNDVASSDSGDLADAVSASSESCIFKSVEHKYVRKVSFSRVALEESLSKSSELDKFKKDKFIDFDLDGEDSILEVEVVHGEQAKGKKKLVFQAMSPTMKSRKLYDFVVVRSEDRRSGYCIRNVKIQKDIVKDSVITFHFDLYSLKDSKQLKVEEGKKMKLRFDDPYKIDDDFIDYAFRDNAFDHNILAASLQSILEDDTPADPVNNTEASDSDCRDAQRPLIPMEEPQGLQATSFVTFGQPICETDMKVNWNPFKDRIISTVAAIFLESVESYRAIVSSTGLESFCDMLIINGSSEMRKWKLLGSIDEIMDGYHSLSIKNAAQEPQSSRLRTKKLESQSQKSSNDKMTDGLCQHDASKRSSRIPAEYNFEAAKEGKKAVITCKRSDFKSFKKLSRADSVRADFSLHYSEDVVSPAESGSSFENRIEIGAAQEFTEKKKWLPFQPGCTFEIAWKKAQNSEEGVYKDISCTVNRDHYMSRPDFRIVTIPEPKPFMRAPESPTVDTNAESKASASDKTVESCYMHVQCFDALKQSLETITADDSVVNSVDATVYSHQLLDAYKPKGRFATYSVLIHFLVCTGVACPSLVLFTLWGFNAVETYAIHPYHTPAGYFYIFALIYMAIVFLYFFLVYLEFSYLIHGESLCGRNPNSYLCCFKPLTGPWLFFSRGLFHTAVRIMLVLDVMAIVLFLIWLCLGVVVQPALAIPYFTGVAAFIGNITSLISSVRNLQDTVINLALDKLETLLDPFKHTLESALDTIIVNIESLVEENFEGTEDYSIEEGSVEDTIPEPVGASRVYFSHIRGEKMIAVLEKLKVLRDSFSSSDGRAVASNAVQEVAQRASSALGEVSRPQFRKLKESEISVLFKNLWSSIREEVGLSSRNIITALLGSSLILGSFLLFIFIGIGIFADGSNPFAAVVNAGLTISAGLCERQRTQSQTSEAAKGSALLEEMFSSLLLALESRLKKSKLAIIQIFVVMMSSEAESTAIISSLQEMKFDMEALCSEDVQVPSAEAKSRRLSSAQVPSAEAKSRRLSSAQVLSAEARSRRLSRAQA